MPIGLANRRRRAVSLEQAAGPETTPCPACGEPLFVWLEAQGYGPVEDQVIDRCENCGLAVARDSVPSPEAAIDALLSEPHETSRAGARPRINGERIAIRADNARSLQA